MNVLLDTCTFLWLALEPDRISTVAQEIVNDPETKPHLSMVSVMEITLKNRSGKLPLPLPPPEWIPSRRNFFQLTELPITEAIIFRSFQLPDTHKDPFDRLIAATAIESATIILSPDTQLSTLGASRLW